MDSLGDEGALVEEETWEKSHILFNSSSAFLSAFRTAKLVGSSCLLQHPQQQHPITHSQLKSLQIQINLKVPDQSLKTLALVQRTLEEWKRGSCLVDPRQAVVQVLRKPRRTMWNLMQTGRLIRFHSSSPRCRKRTLVWNWMKCSKPWNPQRDFCKIKVQSVGRADTGTCCE